MSAARDPTIDVLRGLAIFTMIGANLAGPVLAGPHPFGVRYYGSFAAPLFILLAGMMVALSGTTKGYGPGYFARRGALILGFGAVVDVVIWKIYPFTGMDVLYLIGLSLPVAALLRGVNPLSRWVIALTLFLVTPAFQNLLGYTDYPSEVHLWGEPVAVVANQTTVLTHWVVDGWFPIFPWLGFALVGVALAALRWRPRSRTTFGTRPVLLVGLGLWALGSLLWWLYPGRLLTREGFSELFYPPTVGYVMSALGLILLLFAVVDWKPLALYGPLRALGESALFLYILHLALIEYLIAPRWAGQPLGAFGGIYLALLAFLIAIAYGLRALKARWTARPFLLRVLLGG